jgi:Ca2+-dependent lipid-binding protein
VELVVQPLPSRLPVPLLGRAPLIAGATRTLARAVKVRAGVERVAAAARVRVELAPLLRELPVAGAVSVSLVAPPDVRFALTVYGGDVTLVPGLEGFLASVLRDAVRPYVLPGRFTYPLVPGPAPGVSLPTGMAFVTVVEATNLPWMDVFSPSDAYVELSIGGGRPHRTRVVPNSSNPTWDQDVALLVHAPATQLEAVRHRGRGGGRGGEFLVFFSIKKRDDPPP